MIEKRDGLSSQSYWVWFWRGGRPNSFLAAGTVLSPVGSLRCPFATSTNRRGINKIYPWEIEDIDINDVVWLLTFSNLYWLHSKVLILSSHTIHDGLRYNIRWCNHLHRKNFTQMVDILSKRSIGVYFGINLILEIRDAVAEGSILDLICAYPRWFYELDANTPSLYRY